MMCEICVRYVAMMPSVPPFDDWKPSCGFNSNLVTWCYASKCRMVEVHCQHSKSEKKETYNICVERIYWKEMIARYTVQVQAQWRWLVSIVHDDSASCKILKLAEMKQKGQDL
jgi:hypothetical protein